VHNHLFICVLSFIHRCAWLIHVYNDSLISAQWLIYTWFIFVLFLIHMCATTHSYVCHDSFIRASWLIYIRVITNAYVRHESFICAPWLIYTCTMTHLYVCYHSCMCVSWLIHMCAITHSYERHDSFNSVPCIHMCVMTHSYACHGSFICLPWRIHMCAMNLSYVCHDPCMCVPWLTHMCAITNSYVNNDTVCVFVHVCERMCVCACLCVYVCVCVCYMQIHKYKHTYTAAGLWYFGHINCRTSSHLCTFATAAAASLTGTKPTDSHAEADHSILAAELPGDLKHASAQKTNTSTNIYMPYMYVSFLTRILCSNIMIQLPACHIHLLGRKNMYVTPKRQQARTAFFNAAKAPGCVDSEASLSMMVSNSKNGWINCQKLLTANNYSFSP